MPLSNPDSYRSRVGLYVPAFFDPVKNGIKKELHCHPSCKKNLLCYEIYSFIQQILSLWSLRKPEYIALLRYQHLHD
jgi:hypothetical protein